MKARLYNSPLLQELLDEITPEEMEATKQQMLKQIEMENKTAMMQLLAQLRDERKNMPLNIEWDRCYQAVEMVIENTYIPLEKEQILNTGRYYYHERGKLTPTQYYNETFKSEQNDNTEMA